MELKGCSIKKASVQNFDVLCRVFEEAGGEAACCYCIATWVNNYHERPAEENKAYKLELLKRGDSGGYIFYYEDRPSGWCLCIPESKVPNVQKFNLPILESSYWLKCLVMNPSIRMKGFTAVFIRLMVDDLKKSGARYVRAMTSLPRKASDTDLCAGPISSYLKNGFELEKVHKDEWPIYRLNLEA
jgi:hypothetical protein